MGDYVAGVDACSPHADDLGKTFVYRKGELIATYTPRPDSVYEMDEEAKRMARYFGTRVEPENSPQEVTEDAEVVSIETVQRKSLPL